MSVESVLQKCVYAAPHSDEELKKIKELLLQDLKKQKARFEKVVRTYVFEGDNMSMWNMGSDSF